MAQFTFLEVHLDGAQFSAKAPFSDTDAREAKDEVESSLEDRFQRESDASGTGRSPVVLLLGFIALAGAVAVARKVRSRRRGTDAEADLEADEPIIAD